MDEKSAKELIREASYDVEPDTISSDRVVSLSIAEAMIDKAVKEVFNDIDNFLNRYDFWCTGSEFDLEYKKLKKKHLPE